MSVHEKGTTLYYLVCDGCSYMIGRQVEGKYNLKPAPITVTFVEDDASVVEKHYCDQSCFEYGTDKARAKRLNMSTLDKAYPRRDVDVIGKVLP